MRRIRKHPSPSDIQTYNGFLASVANAMKGRLSTLGKPVLGSVDWLRRASFAMNCCRSSSAWRRLRWRDTTYGQIILQLIFAHMVYGLHGLQRKTYAESLQPEEHKWTVQSFTLIFINPAWVT
ncbi:hypothetical protein I7I48_04226 [Histoplasma ohiense]|nr:hypothetical protein I7I48_04226 [Histoplasma ohiense (nom. inval.)]